MRRLGSAEAPMPILVACITRAVSTTANLFNVTSRGIGAHRVWRRPRPRNQANDLARADREDSRGQPRRRTPEQASTSSMGVRPVKLIE